MSALAEIVGWVTLAVLLAGCIGLIDVRLSIETKKEDECSEN